MFAHARRKNNIRAFVAAHIAGFAGIVVSLTGGAFDDFSGFGDLESFGRSLVSF